MSLAYDAWNPRPVLTLNGDRIPDGTTGVDAPVALAGLTITWGRSSYLDMPRAATMRVTLYDRTGAWTQPAARYPVGTVCDLLADPITYDEWTVFHGRIAAASYEPGPTDPATGAPRHWLVHLTASDITAQLGNVIIPDGTVWPAETALNRAIRLNDAGASTDIEAVYFRPDAVDWQMSPQDVGGKDLLSLLDTFYRSLGSTWAYNPQDNTLRDQFRLQSSAMRSIVWGYAAGSSLCRIIAGSTTYQGKDGPSDPATIIYTGIGLPGCNLTAHGDAVDLAPSLNANRVECKWTDLVTDPSGKLQTTSYTDLGRAAWDTTRTMRYESWLADGVQVDPVLVGWSKRIMYEGDLPRHPDVTWDARRRGFYSQTQAYGLLRAGETPAALYINGSKYSDVVRHGSTSDMVTPPPTYSALGGTITHDGGWEVSLALQAWATNNPAAGTVSWSDMQPTGVQWGDPGDWLVHAPAPYRMDRSVTWSDMSAATDVLVN